MMPARSAMTVALLLLTGLPLCAQKDAAEEVAEIAKGVSSKLVPYESEHFIWALCMAPARARPMIAGAEKAYDEVARVFGVEEMGELWGRRKALMVACKNKVQYRRLVEFYAEKYAGPYLWEGFGRYVARRPYWPQPVPRVTGMMHLKPADMKDLQQTAVHLVGHLGIMRYKFHNNHIPPWLEEGFACWLEAKIMGNNNRFCFTGGYGDVAKEIDKFTNIKWLAWKKRVKLRSMRGLDKTMENLIPLRLNQLTADDIGKAWSVVDFMISRENGRFARFVELMKAGWPKTYEAEYLPSKGEAQERALKNVLDMTWEDLDREWLKYVRTAYR